MLNDEELARAQAEYERIRPDYEAYADALRVLLAQLLRDEGIDIEPVSARAKDVPSLVDKLRRKGEYTAVDDVVDKCGVRIVTRYHADVVRVCGLLEEEFTVREITDHGAEDIQSFGYASRHMIVELHARRRRLREWRRFHHLVAEIQVRSILQHAWASISHGLDYKTDADVPATVRRTLFRVAALLETGDELFDNFRADVERLKSGYRDNVERDEWADLRLDQDSLTAAWSRLPMVELATTAEENGWLDGKAYEPSSEPPESDVARRRVSRMIAIASALGIRTLGELAHEIAAIIADRSQLEHVAEVAAERGYRPYAIPPDIVGLVLMARDRRGLARAVLEREDIAYHDTLMAAIAEIVEGEGDS